MFIARVKGCRSAAFTLLEITLAVAILAMMSLAIYRFVQANIVALRVSAADAATDASYNGLVNLLTMQMQTLSPNDAAFGGEPFKFNDQPRDEMTWTCGAGPGLLTRFATGRYVVSMRLRPISKKTDRMEIGFSRTPEEERGLGNDHESWIPLIQDVKSLQIRYFDPRLNSWVERWTDTLTLPRLVKLTIGRSDNSVPWEAIVATGRTPL